VVVKIRNKCVIFNNDTSRPFTGTREADEPHLLEETGLLFGRAACPAEASAKEEGATSAVPTN